ncbi:MAG: DNA-binding protein [Flavobacteriia bacterium]|nr:DNA-binding protein [Flavobacteriia bacterium]
MSKRPNVQFQGFLFLRRREPLGAWIFMEVFRQSRRPSPYYFNLIRLRYQHNKGKLTQEEGDRLIQDIIIQPSPRNIDEFLLQMKISLDAIFQTLQNSIMHYQIQNNKEHKRVSVEHDEVLRIEDICKQFKVARPTINKWRSEGLMHFKDGKNVFFYRKDINDFLRLKEK